MESRGGLRPYAPHHAGGGPHRPDGPQHRPGHQRGGAAGRHRGPQPRPGIRRLPQHDDPQAADLNLRHAFADSSYSRALTAGANYAAYRLGRQQGLSALPDAGGGAPTGLTSDQAGHLTLLTGQLGYAQPLARRRLLSGGLKISRVQSRNDAVFRQTNNGLTTLDTLQTNQFLYTETIRAAYLSWQQTGARAT